MSKKVILFTISSLLVLIISVFYASGVFVLSRGGVDIAGPVNASKIYNFDSSTILLANVFNGNTNLTLSGGNITANVTWFFQLTNSTNVTLLTILNWNVTNGTINWTAVNGLDSGRYNITLVATNDSTFNLTVGGFGNNPFLNSSNATAGYNVLLVKNLDPTGVIMSSPTAGQNISGTVSLNGTLGDLNMTTNVTWILSVATNGTNETLRTLNAINSLNTTNDTIYLRASNDTVKAFNLTLVASNVRIDNTPPKITIESSDADNKIFTRGEIIITCQNSDTLSNVNSISDQMKLTKPNGDVETFSDSKGVKEKTFKDLDTAQSGEYKVECLSTDFAGNQKTESITYDVNARTSAPTGGAGGGGVSFDISLVGKDTTVTSGREGSEKTFTVDGTTSHSISFLKVTETSATLRISSTPQEFTLNVGNSQDVDLNDDGKVDVKVTLTSIVNGRASLLIDKLAGAAMIGEVPGEEGTGAPTPSQAGTAAGGPGPLTAGGAGATTTVIVIIVILIVVIGGYYLWKGKGKSKKGHIKFTRSELKPTKTSK